MEDGSKEFDVEPKCRYTMLTCHNNLILFSHLACTRPDALTSGSPCRGGMEDKLVAEATNSACCACLLKTAAPTTVEYNLTPEENKIVLVLTSLGMANQRLENPRRPKDFLFGCV